MKHGKDREIHMNIAKKVRMAIIGIGNMGRTYACNIADGFVEGMELTAVCCRNEEGRRWAKERLGEGLVLVDSTDKLFELEDVFDAVLIVTPHKIHPELTIKAFEKGYHVFCDKPAGITARDARRMIESGKRAGKAYAMMFHNRTMPVYEKIKEMLTLGEVGELLRIDYVNTKPYRTKCYHTSSPWRSSFEHEGGGLLINQGQHYLDLWQWLFGMPKRLTATIDYGKYNDFTVDDNCTIYMEFAGGVRGRFFSSTGEPAGEERIEVVGTKAKLVCLDGTLTVSRYERSTKEWYETNTEPFGKLKIEKEVITYEPCKAPYVVMLQNFSDHLRKGVALIADGYDGYRTLQLSNAAYTSSWLEKEIELPVEETVFAQLLNEAVKKEQEKKSKETRS